MKCKLISAGLLVMAMAMAALGCSWPGPHLQHNREVAAQFDGYRIYPDYQYYTSGTVDEPLAILALKPGYTLNAPGWQQVTLNSNDLEQWIMAMKKDFFVEENIFSNGAHIVGKDGTVTGFYYSVWEFPRVRMAGEKTIAMNKPVNDYRLTNEHNSRLLQNGIFWD